MTEKPNRAGSTPQVTNLEEGNTYAWCACGKSTQKTFCDGSHKGSSFSPVVFKVEKSGPAAICLCKATSNPPYCDGSHQTL
jgi:CDGSH-type Zn-finger protein